MVERDSNYKIDTSLIRHIESIYIICKENNIPFAIFNTPLRPSIISRADLPYAHRREAYDAIAVIAHKHNFPIWNLDNVGYFVDDNFRDTYHVTPHGARKLSALVLKDILEWKSGIIRQDSAFDFPIPK